MKKIYFLLSIVLLSISTTFAQTTFQRVKTILQTNCDGSGCHGGSLPGFNVNATDAALHAALVGVSPLNPTAASKGDKLVYVGHPSKSFLLRKMAHNLDNDDLGLDAAEGAAMPSARPKLPDAEIELVRQWILFGATINNPTLPNGYSGVNFSNIEKYYNGETKPRIARPASPALGEGVQVKMGPIFFGPREEAEYYLKYELDLPDTIEVTRLELFMNNESHHFILRKFAANKKQNWKDGLQTLNFATFFTNDKDYVMAWQGNEDVELPQLTAYRWEDGAALDLNFHMFNYHDSVLVGDVYLNIYTQPKNTAKNEMKAVLVPNASINMSADSNVIQSFGNTWSKKNISIWSLTSHTHSRGVDYDIYARNADGSVGIKLFEGHEKNGINTGFYDWEHPPIKLFEPMFYLDPTLYSGLIDTAKYRNNTGASLGWGFTTDREMMLYYVQFIDGEFDSSTSVEEVIAKNNDMLNVYPNPFSNRTQIHYTLTQEAEVNLEVYDLTGRKVKTFANTRFQPGIYNYTFENETGNDGVYLIKLTIDGKSTFRKVVQM